MENFVLREMIVDENGWQDNVCYQVDTSALHGIPTITMLQHNWDRDINDFATKTQVQAAVNTFQCS